MISKIFENLLEEDKKTEENNLNQYRSYILAQERKKLDSIDRVFLARYKNRPKTIDFIENLIEEPIFFHGDRLFADDNSIIAGIGKFKSQIVTFIAINKGRSMDENIENHFGMVNPEGYRKAVRMMKQAEKFKRPLLIFIDTPGAYPGKAAEERGQSEAIAKSIYTMTSLKTPIISVITGEGASGGAIALCVSDKLIMMENSIYSILSPEGFASILWKDPKEADKAKKMMRLTAHDLFEFKIADEIIKEDLVLYKEEFTNNYKRLEKSLEKNLNDLKDINIENLLKIRRERFRNYGTNI